MTGRHGQPAAYERIVRSLLLSKLAGGPRFAMQSHHLKRYTGRSGQEHEIDVSFEIDIDGIKFMVLVECKDYGRKVGVKDIMTLAYRVRDIGAHKGLLVTTRGFQRGAKILAKAEGIGLLLAARGVIRVYLGREYTLYEHWIHRLQIQVSPGTRRVRLLGLRLIAGNCHSLAVPYHTSNDSKEVGKDEIAFLTEKEADKVKSGQRVRRKRGVATGFERKITSRRNSKPVVIC